MKKFLGLKLACMAVVLVGASCLHGNSTSDAMEWYKNHVVELNLSVKDKQKVATYLYYRYIQATAQIATNVEAADAAHAAWRVVDSAYIRPHNEATYAVETYALAATYAYMPDVYLACYGEIVNDIADKTILSGKDKGVTFPTVDELTGAFASDKTNKCIKVNAWVRKYSKLADWTIKGFCS